MDRAENAPKKIRIQLVWFVKYFLCFPQLIYSREVTCIATCCSFPKSLACELQCNQTSQLILGKGGAEKSSGISRNGDARHFDFHSNETFKKGKIGFLSFHTELLRRQVVSHPSVNSQRMVAPFFYLFFCVTFKQAPLHSRPLNPFFFFF